MANFIFELKFSTRSETMPRFFVKSCDSDSEDEFSDEDSAKLNIFRVSPLKI